MEEAVVIGQVGKMSFHVIAMLLLVAADLSFFVTRVRCTKTMPHVGNSEAADKLLHPNY